jgi:hypothetical protein
MVLGMYRFFGIAVLLHVKRHTSGRTTFLEEDHPELQVDFWELVSISGAKHRLDNSTELHEIRKVHPREPEGWHVAIGTSGCRSLQAPSFRRHHSGSAKSSRLVRAVQVDGGGEHRHLHAQWVVPAAQHAAATIALGQMARLGDAGRIRL